MSSSADLPAADTGLRQRNAGGVHPESVPSVEKPTADDRINTTASTAQTTGQQQNSETTAVDRDGGASKSNKTYGRTPDGTGTYTPLFRIAPLLLLTSGPRLRRRKLTVAECV